MKTCIKCNLEKETSEFPKRRGAIDGTRNECKICYNQRLSKWSKQLGYKHQYKYYHMFGKYNIKHKRLLLTETEIKEKNLDARLSKYSLSIKEYEELVHIQNNKCAICEKEFSSTPHIDHCHSTGKVRGLLCNTCNWLLGYAKDNTEILKKSIIYLENK